MSEQIMVHKPAGKIIEKNVFDKLKKEYLGTEIFYIYKLAGTNKWFYSDKSCKITEYSLLNEETESVIYLNKTSYMANLGNPVNFIQNADNWFVTCGLGNFPFLTSTNQRGPEVIYKAFLKFLDITSLHAFLQSLCKKYDVQYASVANGTSIRRHGNWEEIDGIWYTNTNFYYKLDYDVKTLIKNVVAFFKNPLDVKSEIKRMDAYSDLKLREECANVPNLLTAIQNMS